MKSSEKKVLVIGLDGATFDLMEKWMEEGELPYFKELTEGGTRARLESTMPPVTGPAWTSFQTGVNPGKHGIFDWGSSEGENYGRGIVDSTHIKTKTMWRLLSDQKKKVISVGLPVTYPPEQVNGVMASGVLTPGGADDYLYPPRLKKELEREVGKYITAPTHAEMAVNTSAWIRELNKSIVNKEKTSRFLLEEEEWDVSMVYFMETDTVMHHLYHTIEEKGKESKIKGDLLRSAENPVLQIFQRVEKAVQNIVSEAESEELSVLIVSDHGFGPLEWIFNVNSWLHEEGYLAFKDSFVTRLKKIAGRAGFNQKNLYNLGNLLGPLGRGKKWDIDGINDILGSMFLSMGDVDWSRTKAFSRGGVTGQIRLNLKDRETEGIVDPEEATAVKKELMKDLSDLRSPYTGEPVVEKVMPREEVYSGPMTDLGPDILFKTEGMRTDTGGMTVFKTLDSIIPAFAITGTHRMDGVFIASGPDFKEDERVEKMSIMDGLPNILYLLGLDIPNYLDGSVRCDLFEEEFAGANSPNYVDMEMGEGEAVREGSEVDGEIEDRLKNLGYLA